MTFIIANDHFTYVKRFLFTYTFPGLTLINWMLGRIFIVTVVIGMTIDRVVKALDSQPRHRGFESGHTLSLQ